MVTVGACWAGDLERGERAVQPLRKLGTPLVDRLGRRPYLELQGLFDAAVPHGWHRYWKSIETPPLEEAVIETLVDHISRITSPRSYTIIFQLGGALARVAEDATAYPQRDAAFNVNINAVWTEDDPDAHRHIRWARDLFDAVQPHARDRVYVNFLGDEGPGRVRQAYGTEKYDRLVALKRSYDPTNFFRLNQNIPPKSL
jgi:FAD/FMN-containing dehydrogenase